MEDTSTGCGFFILILLFAGFVMTCVESCNGSKSTDPFSGMTQQERIDKKWEMLNNNQNW